VNGTSDFWPLAWVESSSPLATHMGRGKSLGQYSHAYLNSCARDVSTVPLGSGGRVKTLWRDLGILGILERVVGNYALLNSSRKDAKMTRKNFEAETPLQALMMEQALAMAKQLEQTGRKAPDGQVLDQLETKVMQMGREFMRRSLQGAMQTEIEEVEKKIISGS